MAAEYQSDTQSNATAESTHNNNATQPLQHDTSISNLLNTTQSSYEMLNHTNNTDALLAQPLPQQPDSLSGLKQRTETLEHMTLLQSTGTALKNQFIREYIVNATNREIELRQLTEQIKTEAELQQTQQQLKYEAEMKYIQQQLDALKHSTNTAAAQPAPAAQPAQQAVPSALYGVPMSPALQAALQHVHSINAVHNTMRQYPYYTATDMLHDTDSDTEHGDSKQGDSKQQTDSAQQQPQQQAQTHTSADKRKAQREHSNFTKLLRKFEQRVNDKHALKQQHAQQPAEAQPTPQQTLPGAEPPQLSYDSELRAELLLWRHYYSKLKRKYDKLKLQLKSHSDTDSSKDAQIKQLQQQVAQLQQQIDDIQNDKIKQRQAYDKVINNIDSSNMWYTEAQKKRLDMLLQQ